MFSNCWVLRVLYIFWIQTELKRLSDFANTFSHSLDCLFTFLVSFEAEKFQFWWSQIYLFFFFCSSGFWCHTKKRLPNSRSQRFTPIFFSKSFIVLTLWFRSLIHFELILYLTWGKGPSFFFWRWISSCARILCPHRIILAYSSSKSTWSLIVTVVTQLYTCVFAKTHWTVC